MLIDDQYPIKNRRSIPTLSRNHETHILTNTETSKMKNMKKCVNCLLLQDQVHIQLQPGLQWVIL